MIRVTVNRSEVLQEVFRQTDETNTLSKKHLKTGMALARQFAALPIAEIDGERRILLVTSRETRRWVLPKGWAEKRMSGPALASKEAWEEAGVLGSIAAMSAGSYTYLKRLDGGATVTCLVDVFPMRVSTLLDAWPEQRERQRAWFTYSQAATAVAEEELVSLLLSLGSMPLPTIRTPA